MDKKEFTAELKELLQAMNEEEIIKTIDALYDCKTQISRKKDGIMGEKARLLETAGGGEAEFYFTCRNKKGILKTAGASLLTAVDHEKAKGVIPKKGNNWWLYDRQIVSGDNRSWYYRPENTGAVRPVIVINEIDEKLRKGETFFINGEPFVFLSPCLALKVNFMEDECTFNVANYESSLIKLCVDAWYRDFAQKNAEAEKIRSAS